MQNQPNETAALSRRQFIKSSSLIAATTAAATSFPGILHAQSKAPINAVVIGMGGRGSGAAGNFMEAARIVGANAKIVGTADMFPEVAARGTGDPFNAPKDKCFSGFDAYKKVLEIPGVNYAIIATPPGFRPPIFKACVDAGKNVFMEKPVATDGTGIRVMYAAAEAAKAKGLKIAAGTQRRHRPSYIETVKRIQGGEIGDITALRVYWVNNGPIWHRGDQGATDLERQVRNWYHYIWLCGDHICEQHVHDLDIANWIMKDHPIRAWGQGSRQQLGDKSGEIWDNFDVEYEYPNGVRMFSYCGQIKRSFGSVSEHAIGSSGTADMLDGNNVVKPKGGNAWRARGLFKNDDGYVNEHVDLINAILNDQELNEAKNVIDTTMTAILGREAAYSGMQLEWDAVRDSKFMYGPADLYENAYKLQFGPFRTLKPPMPSLHDVTKDPAIVAGA